MSFDLHTFQIETERLLLVPVSLDYTDQMLAELTEDITKYMAIFPPKTIDEEVFFVTSSIEKMNNGTDISLLILDKSTREYLGGVGVHKLGTKTPELGIWTKQSAHGKKIGREAVTGLKKWVEKHIAFDYLVYPVHKDNIPSRKIAESLGGIVVSEGIKTFPSGKQLDEVVYHIPRLEK